MPELPEVERARRLLERLLKGRKLKAVATRPDPVMFEGISARGFAKSLAGRRVVAVRRRGKHLWLELDRRPWPAFHFGMSGGFEAYREGGGKPRFWKVELRTDAGACVALRDPRRFGRIRLLRDPENEPPIRELGFDPLVEHPPLATLVRLFCGRRTLVKAILLDQSAFAGVGNWVADEVLFQSGIRPDRAALSLTSDEVGRLRRCLRSVIRKAVAVDADAERFPRTWLFHHRWRTDPLARTSRGERIVRQTIAGRTTAWVPARQR